MLVQYDGPHPAVEIDVTSQLVERGVPLEVETSVAESLLHQSTWTKVAKAAPVPEKDGK